MRETTVSRSAAQAVGRCYGALFFAGFGGAWLLLSAYAFGRLNRIGAAGIGFLVLVFAAIAVRLMRRGTGPALNAVPANEQSSNDRRFGIVNAVTWVSVFLVFQVFPRLGIKDLDIPAVVFLVGAHFFPMPPLYRHRSNLLLGGALMFWAVLCPLVFRGDSMIALVALGAGLALWTAAVWALMTAARLLRSEML